MEDTIFIPILQMREMKQPDTKWKSQDLDPGILAVEFVHLIYSLQSGILKIDIECSLFFHSWRYSAENCKNKETEQTVGLSFQCGSCDCVNAA